MLLPGAVPLGNPRDCLECGHQHSSARERCLSFHFDQCETDILVRQACNRTEGLTMTYRWLLALLALGASAQLPQVSRPAAASTTVAAGSAARAVAAADIRTLGEYQWRLIGATNSAGKRIDALFVRADMPLQLEFSAGRLSISNSCNNISGAYSISRGRLQVSPMVQTMMACHDAALAALDSAIIQRLQGEAALSIQTDGNAPRLQLITDHGDTLSFTGVPTPETRYGGPGQIVFLEVAAQTVPCGRVLVPAKQCLQVRERHFDEHGLPSGAPGAWHPLYQNIEGYTHQSGIRNVLRLKRFAIKNPPVDAPSTAYVLDLVVESEKVSH